MIAPSREARLLRPASLSGLCTAPKQGQAPPPALPTTEFPVCPATATTAAIWMICVTVSACIYPALTVATLYLTVSCLYLDVVPNPVSGRY